MTLPYVRSAEDVVALAEDIGFLPFFRGAIPGFSIEECCPGNLWFSDTQDGPWEWKGPVARTGRVIYGKLFSGKAGYVSAEWFPELANFRRDGYDFDARWDDGLVRAADKRVYDEIAARGEIVSRDLKLRLHYQKGGNTGFDGIVTRLQAETYVNISDFVYNRDRHGKPYGWGVAVYSTPERTLGEACVTSAYVREPGESLERMMAHVSRLVPEAGERELLKFLGARR